MLGLKISTTLYLDERYLQIVELKRALLDLQIQYWLHHTFHLWTWWFLLFWTIVPFFIWWKFIDKKRFLEISFFGLLLGLSAGVLDSIGVTTVAWEYPDKLIPFLPNLFPVDYVVIPVLFMLIYQKYSGWKAFLLASGIIIIVLSLVIDPFLGRINVYKLLSWSNYYSIPVFLFMVCFAKWVTMVIIKRNNDQGGEPIGD